MQRAEIITASYNPEGQAIAVATEQRRGTLVAKLVAYWGFKRIRTDRLDWIYLESDGSTYLENDVDLKILKKQAKGSVLTLIQTRDTYPSGANLNEPRTFIAALYGQSKIPIYISPGFNPQLASNLLK